MNVIALQVRMYDARAADVNIVLSLGGQHNLYSHEWRLLAGLLG